MHAMFLAAPAQASRQVLNAKLRSGQYIQNVDNIYIILDNSSSMAHYYFSGQHKFSFEKYLVDIFNRTIPDLKINAALRTFGSDYCLFDATNLLYGVTTYDPDALDKVIQKVHFRCGNSPLDKAVTAAGDDLKAVQGKIALVIFTDGEDMGSALLQAATNVKADLGDRLCIYTVQVGYSEKGRKILNEVVTIGQCGFPARGDLLMGDAEMTDFVERICLAPAPPPPPPPPPPAKEPEVIAPPPPAVETKRAPEAATVVEQAMLREGRVTLVIEFDTAKAIVKPKYYKEIKKITDVMEKHPDWNILIEGHTDNVGGEKYNLRLSQRRAEAVKKVMETRFKIDAARIRAKGFGYFRPKASNKTADGRHRNRRVEAVLD
jgi:OOP family OmpA-OmpF porin